MEFDPNQGGGLRKRGRFSLDDKDEPMQKQIDKIVNEFDLRGDRRISPEEFFNIVMALYE